MSDGIANTAPAGETATMAARTSHDPPSTARAADAVASPLPLALVAAGFALSFVLVGGGINTVGVFVNAVAETEHWSRSGMSTAVSVGAVTAALTTPGVGVAVDRFGVRVPIAAGLVSLLVGYAITSQMQAPWHFLLANLFLGVGFAACSPFPITIAISVRGGDRTALALGLAASGSSVGSLLLLPAVQAAVDATSWRIVYVGIAFAVLLTTLALLAFLLPRGPLPRADAGPRPTIGLADLRRPGVARLAALLVLPGLVTFAISVHAVPYFTSTGLSASTAALVLGSAVGLSLIGKVLGGVAADRFGALPTLRAALACGAIGIGVLTTSHAPAALAAFALLYGLYLGTQVATLPLVALRVVGADRFGSLFGTLQLGGMLAAGAGPVIAGALFDRLGRYDEVLWVWIAAIVASIVVTIGLASRLPPALAETAP